MEGLTPVSVAGGTGAVPVAVTYGVSGTAAAGTHYTAPSGSLTLAAGATSGTIAIPTLTDAVLDGGETLVMTLTGASTTTGTVTADAAAAETTISDPGTVTVSLAADAVGGRGRRGHVHGGAVGGGVEPGDAALVDVGRHGGGRRRLHRGVGHVDVPRQLDGQADPLGDDPGRRPRRGRRDVRGDPYRLGPARRRVAGDGVGDGDDPRRG